MSIDISNVTISKMSSDTAQVIIDIYTNYKCLDKLFIDKYLYMHVYRHCSSNVHLQKHCSSDFKIYLLKLLSFTHLQTLLLLVHVMHNHLQILILK